MITLDLPPPISVNRSRRIDWREHKNVKEWLRQADACFMLRKRELVPLAIPGEYEIVITLRDGSLTDADNAIKTVIDAVRRWRLVTDDSPSFMRRLVVEFGDAPTGCRVTVNPLGEESE